MENIINDYLRQIFTSGALTENERKNMLGILKIRDVRSHLAKVAFQCKFKEVSYLNIILRKKQFALEKRASQICRT